MSERYAWENLRPWIDAMLVQDEDRTRQSHIGEIGLMANVSGIDRKQLHRWRRDGFTANGADRIAIALGEHPLTFWPEWGTVEVSTTEERRKRRDRERKRGQRSASQDASRSATSSDSAAA